MSEAGSAPWRWRIPPRLPEIAFEPRHFGGGGFDELRCDIFDVGVAFRIPRGWVGDCREIRAASDGFAAAATAPGEPLSACPSSGRAPQLSPARIGRAPGRAECARTAKVSDLCRVEAVSRSSIRVLESSVEVDERDGPDDRHDHAGAIGGLTLGQELLHARPVRECRLRATAKVSPSTPKTIRCLGNARTRRLAE